MLFKRFWRVNEVGRAINDDNVVCFSTVIFDELPSFGVVEFGASACADEPGWRLTLDIRIGCFAVSGPRAECFVSKCFLKFEVVVLNDSSCLQWSHIALLFPLAVKCNHISLRFLRLPDIVQ